MMRKAKQPRLPEGDDGRTIASMNVEGMPWYHPEKAEASCPKNSQPESSLTRQQTREYTMGALKAALLVTLIMCGGLVLFVAFCQFIWFRP